MTAGAGYVPSGSQPLLTPQAKNVDKLASGLAGRALAALDLKGPTRRSHSDVIDSNIGWAIDPLKWAASAKASKVLSDQSARIADALERMGVPSRLDSEITCIGAVTGVVESVPLYRAIRFIPSVAARDRRPVLNALKFWIDTRPESRYFRYAVFTAPEPVPYGGTLRETIQGLSRRISKWATEARSHSVEVLFRGIEFTRSTAAERDAEAAERGKTSNLSERFGPDTVLYHVHANVITWPKRAMKTADWSAFLSMTWRAVKAHWKDNGSIRKAEEVVKYCLKPSDIESAPDEEMVWLYRETERLKLVQPLGPFATFLSEMEENGEKVVRVKVGGAGKLLKIRKSKRLGHRDPEANAWVEEAAREAGVEREAKQKNSDGDKAPPTNLLLGISLPQWRNSPWAEPVFLVQRYDPETTNRASIGRLDDMEVERRMLRAQWDASGAPEPKEALRIAEQALSAEGEACRYNVHTLRPTVPKPSEAKAAGSWPKSASHESTDAPSDSGLARRLKLLFEFDENDELIPYEPPASPFVMEMRAMLDRRASESAALAA